jgi:acyl-coenzyme A synthetase/AMP-(fatty) acid ligase
VFVDEPLADDLRRELGVCDASPTMIVVPASPHESHTWRIEAVAAGEESPPIMRSPDNMAFLLYTSGSTGAPKAVVLTDRNVVSFVDWCSEAFAVHASDKFATHAPLQFSLVVFHLYVAWKHGAAVVLIDEQTAKTPALLAPLIEQRGITIWFSAPTILGLLAQSGELASRVYPSLRLVMFGGTPFPQSHFRQLRAELPRPRYLHIFGSTETHIMARFEIPPELPADTAAAIPIGEISSHFRSRIIGEDGNDVPSGVDGELCLCGPGVTPGYWKTPADRALAFFTDAAGDRWYRTGDIVVAQASGCLIHRGRRDRMIKKRGYRVELAEIETCLHENLAVKEAAVVAVTDEELGMRVHAFVVAQSGTRPTIIGLKAHCVGSLPAYMVPDVFAFVEALPRTSSGKIDFPALRERSESHKE